MKHSLIYNSFYCSTKLSCHVFSDSKIGSKLSCEKKTKAEALEANILAPWALNNF
jgi:hypothetical protein